MCNPCQDAEESVPGGWSWEGEGGAVTRLEDGARFPSRLAALQWLLATDLAEEAEMMRRCLHHEMWRDDQVRRMECTREEIYSG